MNSFNRKVTALTAIVAIGLLSGLATQATASTKSGDGPMCREVTRKVAVYPTAGHPSKSLRLPRFESRTYSVCDHDNMMSKPKRTASASSAEAAQG